MNPPKELTVQAFELCFKQPARTSRNTMITRKIWVLNYGKAQGECAPLPGLSPDWVDESQWNRVLHQAVTRFNTVAAGTDDTTTLAQSFQTELDLYRREQPSLVFGFESLLKQLSKQPHTPEDHAEPLAVRYDALLPTLCQSCALPVALDESLLVRYPEEKSRDWLASSGVAFLVLKPGLLGGFGLAESWIQTAESLGLGWWITSALESNIGLQALALWTLEQTRCYGNSLAQGLGTGSLFTNNFPSSLRVQSGFLSWE